MRRCRAGRRVAPVADQEPARSRSFGKLTSPMRRFDTRDADFDAVFQAFLDERRGSPADVDAAVAPILDGGKGGGLDAVLEYAERFDKVKLDAETLKVGPEEIARGAAEASSEVREAIRFAA